LSDADRITLAHGAGGRAMHALIEDLLVPAFGGSPEALEDQARLSPPGLEAPGARLALTTDSFVVTPRVFPGGSLGTLAVAGTVNDLCVGGARPHALTCALILEEGLPLSELRRVVDDLAATARRAGVLVATGDVKVVERGAVDGLFVNTTGVGVIPPGRDPACSALRSGDRILVTGPVGDHGAAIAAARGTFGIETELASDCRPLASLVETLFEHCPRVRALRDATRGGVATVLNEFARASRCAIRVEEDAVPVREAVRGFAELLGLDPLYLANEGTLVIAVAPEDTDAALAALRAHADGREAAWIGEVLPGPPGRVTQRGGFGGERVLDVLVGDPLPRIC
jgi:hydrogenase expression/formation protein HypE